MKVNIFTVLYYIGILVTVFDFPRAEDILSTSRYLALVVTFYELQ